MTFLLRTGDRSFLSGDRDVEAHRSGLDALQQISSTINQSINQTTYQRCHDIL